MIETRLQIPDDLYREAERVAGEREITLGEVVRRGLEYIVRVSPRCRRHDRIGTPRHRGHSDTSKPRWKTGGL
jgi:hypothetical protein